MTSIRMKKGGLGSKVKGYLTLSDLADDRQVQLRAFVRQPPASGQPHVSETICGFCSISGKLVDEEAVENDRK